MLFLHFFVRPKAQAAQVKLLAEKNMFPAPQRKISEGAKGLEKQKNARTPKKSPKKCKFDLGTQMIQVIKDLLKSLLTLEEMCRHKCDDIKNVHQIFDFLSCWD